ncbi:rna-directed dna polymerase from mobile element jockey-like [Pitangus sulphuratus]|nr:rna-directed dna polymerase from mobile element jockey-like [Pitangus sulphuratus]
MPEKVMEQIIRSAIMWHIQGVRPRQYRFRKSRSGLTDLIFYDQVTHLVNVVYLNFNKAFVTISQSILLEKLAA